MASLNRVDKVSLDAFSDPSLQTQNANGVYSRFTNVLRTPLLNAKGLQLLNANFINSRLQLDDNSSLVFWYYRFNPINSIGVVRLYPSNFVAPPGFTTFVRNRYFNSVDELVFTLNQAAAVGGDNVTNNVLYHPGEISFSYDANTRRISFVSNNPLVSVGPAAADDPIIMNTLKGNFITMNTLPSASFLQPYIVGKSMNSRLGFAMSTNARPLWQTGASRPIIASSTGLAVTTAIEADANPILLGTQNVSVYASVIAGSGMDFTGRKNLLETVPVQVAPLNINNYTLNSLDNYAMSVPNEIYEITIELLDDNGLPFIQPPNYNTQISLAVLY
jgi:hypothetical protein